MRRRLSLVVFLTLVACGHQSATVGQAASAQLSPVVAQVRTAAANGDRAGAAVKVAELRQSVADLRQRNELTEAAAAKVLTAAAEVEAQLGIAAPGQIPAVSTTPGPPPTGARTPPTTGKGGKGKGKDGGE